jgi:putative glycosyltransferase (TIGR04372 family)
MIFLKKQISDIKKGGLKILFIKIISFLKYLINLPLYIFSLFIVIFLRIISPVLIVRLGQLPCINFGDFLMLTSLYVCKKQLNLEQPKKKFLDIIYLYNPNNFYNKYLEKMWSKEFKIYKSSIFHKINQVNSLLPNSENHSISLFSNGRENDVDNLIAQHQPLTFSNKEIEVGTKELKKLGINFTSDRFVCLAIRDQEFTKMKMKNVNFSYEDYEYRNDDINDFLEGAEELTKKGYFVLRVGRINQKPLKSKNKKIIDYGASEIRSDFMDLFIGANCHFCISSGYGFDYLPYIFNKMIGVLEFPLGETRTFSNKIIILPRKYYSTSEAKYLSINDIFKEKIEFEGNSKLLKNKNIVIKKFNSNEIRDFMLEVEKYSNEENSEKDTYSSQAQSEFEMKFKKLFNKERYLAEKQKPLKRIHGNEIKSIISKSFLKTNNNWLN